MINFERTSYIDAEVIKQKNKRLAVIKTADDQYQLGFRQLSPDPRPRAKHYYDRGIVTTLIAGSIEGAVALYFALQAQLIKDGVLTAPPFVPENPCPETE
jgi:hypothetical protein